MLSVFGWKEQKYSANNPIEICVNFCTHQDKNEACVERRQNPYIYVTCPSHVTLLVPPLTLISDVERKLMNYKTVLESDAPPVSL